MSRLREAFRSNLAALLVIPILAGVGCRTCLRVPCFYADASVREACQGKTAGNHDISVDDTGGVDVSDNCVVISRNQGGTGHRVHWLPKSSGRSVSITFVLIKDQPVPFQNMACGKPDKKGNRLCSLIDCPGNCKTTFRGDYQPSRTNDALNYYYYSPGVTVGTGSTARAGSDPGIRIDP